MVHKRKTTDKPIQGLLTNKITLEHHREIIKDVGRDKSGKSKSLLYSEKKKEAKQDELDSIFSKTANKFERQYGAGEFTITKKLKASAHTSSQIYKPPFPSKTTSKNIASIMNEKRNGETISKFSNWFASTAINVIAPTKIYSERAELAPFIGLLIGEVLKMTFRHEVVFLQNVEVFISIAQKIYKIYVKINDTDDVEIDDKYEFATELDYETFERFKETYYPLLNEFYTADNPIGKITRNVNNNL
ncbi:MAG: hypothetical protein PHC62_11310 [Candidatus Izemoplasmatales bacterium]|nr:hypothetical protein [Candidatus Izemoplasmatales bacterium]